MLPDIADPVHIGRAIKRKRNVDYHVANAEHVAKILDKVKQGINQMNVYATNLCKPINEIPSTKRAIKDTAAKIKNQISQANKGRGASSASGGGNPQSS